MKNSSQKLQKNIAEKLVDFFAEDFKSTGYSSTRENFIYSITHRMENGFSTSWSMGGTYGNCWDEQKGTVDPEPEKDLTDLDNFLIKTYPQTSFMQYKAITNQVTKNTRIDGDYYGGSTLEGTKEISMEKLQDCLVKTSLEEYSDYVSVEDVIATKAQELFPPKQKEAKNKTANYDVKNIIKNTKTVKPTKQTKTKYKL